jgi:ABC-type multidrug transport system fused ATPase/permease subunit
LDPFEQYTDDAVWDALQAVQLADMVRSSGAGLQMPMAEYGSNLSAGECQLVCVARALLKPVKILLVDEATANVDRTTDEVVQRLLRTRFADRTVLTIAHRMLTILDSTKILAMQRGTAMQFDSPTVLCAPLQSESKQAPDQMGLVAQLAAESHISWNDVAALNRAAVAE